MTCWVLGKLVERSSKGGCSLTVEVLLEVEAYRPRPEDSASDRLSRDPG